MGCESTVLHAAERRRLAAAIVAWDTADYVAVRALAALSADALDRVGRFTAMGRQFVADMRRRVRDSGAEAVLDERARASERVLEAATSQIVELGSHAITMRSVADGAGVGRRTLYYTYAGSGDLVAACRRRAQTIWRGRFEQRVLTASDDPRARLFAVADQLDAWVGSPRFARDQALLARPSFTAERHQDDMRDHLNEIQRFATGLAAAANVRAPAEYGVLVTTLAAGAAASFDRREAARAVSAAVIARLIAQACD